MAKTKEKKEQNNRKEVFLKEKEKERKKNIIDITEKIKGNFTGS